MSMIYRLLAINRLCWLNWLLVQIAATRGKIILDIVFPCSVWGACKHDDNVHAGQLPAVRTFGAE
ncbi:MAG: hypothetical protein ACKO2L_08560 [Planctomycetaceae bacterium]